MTTYHRQHGRPVRDPETGRYVIVRPARAPASGGTVRTFHAQHAKPVRDPRTGKYVMVRPSAPRPYAHTPVTTLNARSGKLKRGPARQGGRASPPVHAIASRPDQPTVQARNAFSTQGELYQWHKANGTLPVYYRMYGIDYDPKG